MGGVEHSSQHGQNGAELVDKEKSLQLEAEIRGGGGSDGGHGFSESGKRKTEFDDAKVVDMDGTNRQNRTKPYKYLSIRNGTDEYKWWVEEDII